MAVVPSIFGVAPQLVNTAGEPAVGDKLFFYVAGSNTKQNTYTDSTGMTANPNPIILDALGMPSNEVWWTNGALYKMVWAPSTDTDPPTSPIRTFDNLSGINDSAGGGSGSQSEWVIYPSAPTYINATSFSVAGDQTALFNPKRRVKTVNVGGTIYSTIVSAVFGAVTTVTVVNDSGVLDAGLSQVSYGLLSAVNPSMPEIYAKPGANNDITQALALQGLGNNTSTIYTTGGSSTAYTITPSPAYTAYAIGMSVVVNFHAACGAAPTIEWNGIATPPNLVRELGDGTFANIAANDIPINHRSRVTLISTTQALVEKMPPPFSMVRVHTAGAGGAGYGSTNIAIRRFTTIAASQGSDITYADSATLGASFTINTDGIYAISGNDNAVSAFEYGVSLNSTQLSTNILNITAANRLCETTTAGANYSGAVAVTLYLSAGSVIRPHCGPNPVVGTGTTNFTVTRVA